MRCALRIIKYNHFKYFLVPHIYVESLGRSFSSSLIVSERGPVITGLSAVFWVVRAVFLVILVFEAAERASFSSQIGLGTGVRLNLR